MITVSGQMDNVRHEDPLLHGAIQYWRYLLQHGHYDLTLVYIDKALTTGSLGSLEYAMLQGWRHQLASFHPDCVQIRPEWQAILAKPDGLDIMCQTIIAYWLRLLDEGDYGTIRVGMANMIDTSDVEPIFYSCLCGWLIRVEALCKET